MRIAPCHRHLRRVAGRRLHGRRHGPPGRAKSRRQVRAQRQADGKTGGGQGRTSLRRRSAATPLGTEHWGRGVRMPRGATGPWPRARGLRRWPRARPTPIARNSSVTTATLAAIRRRPPPASVPGPETAAIVRAPREPWLLSSAMVGASPGRGTVRPHLPGASSRRRRPLAQRPRRRLRGLSQPRRQRLPDLTPVSLAERPSAVSNADLRGLGEIDRLKVTEHTRWP